MAEKQKHLELKEQAKQILLSKGFTEEEIWFEYRWKNYIIDVAAIGRNKKCFIECGSIKESKLMELCAIHDGEKELEVIHLPYLEAWISKYNPNKVKVELDKNIVNDLIQKKEVGDTYSDVIRRLLEENK